MTVTINGTTGYSGPVGTIGDLTTTGNTTLGDASGDTLTLNGNTASIPNGLNFTNGNLGLGATPSAWSSSWKALQTNNGYIGNATSNNIAIGGNNYVDSGGAYRYITSAAANQYQLAADGSHFWRIAGSGTAGNTITWTQALTLDANGKLILGTTAVSATETLRVYNATNARLLVDQASNGLVIGADSSGPFFDTTGSNRLGFFVGGTQRMTLDTSGNLGLGVTPSAWWASVTPAIQVANTGSYVASGSNSFSGSQWTWIGNNGFFNSSSQWIYTRSQPAAQYRQLNNEHAWFNAGSGTAGNAISFTQAMTLNASGSLGVGATSGFNAISGTETTVYVKNTNAASLYLDSSSTGKKYAIYSAATGNLSFYDITAGAERMRIDSAGSVGIANTNPSSYSFNGVATSLATGYNIWCGGSMLGYVQSRGYALQDTGGGGTQWTKMGTFYTPGNSGYIVRLEINGHIGFNASINQNEISYVYFKTSNGSSSQAGSTGNFYGDGMFWRLGPSGFNAGVRAIQVSNTEYQLWIYQGGYSNGSYYTVSFSDGCAWTHSGAIGTPSGNYIGLTGYSITYT